MAHFVFLEFTNPKLRNFLEDLSFSLTQRHSTTSMHVTVRGPYDELPDLDTLEGFKEKIRGYGVSISGTGIFKTSKGFSVFLKVHSPVFSEIWWKPDFKDQKITPHITLFETNDEVRAETVRKFLKQENIEIFTLAITLTVYTSKQYELFEENLSNQDLQKRAGFEKWKVKKGILERAQKLFDS